MRRTIGVLCLALLIAAPAAPGLAAPADRTPDAEAIQIALTVFLTKGHGGPPTMYFGGSIAFDVLEAYGFAGRAKCHQHESHGSKQVSCVGLATGEEVAPPAYYMDPLLQRAHVEFDQGKWHHVMDWQSDELPETSQRVKPRHATVEAFVDSSSHGRICGRRFTQRRDQPLSVLIEAAFANVTVDGIHISRTPDGAVRVRATFPANRAG